MKVIEKYPLSDLNSFGIDVKAKYFIEIESDGALEDLFSGSDILQSRHLILGSGSNILFTKDFDGLVIKLSTRGIKLLDDSDGQMLLQAKAGEDWDHLVAHTVNRGWGGLENLSLIPGQVGSSPIQNIGAYGVELKDHFHSLTAFDKKTRAFVHFDEKACAFAYRNSYFKQAGKGAYVITDVTFKLDAVPKIHTHYRALSRELEIYGITNPGIADVREAVCRIRRSKLPDPDKIGNAGSFFKNPVVQKRQYDQLQSDFPNIVAFDDNGGKKLAAAWLIDKAGWKAYRRGDAGVHDKQALVLVNHGQASGQQILELAMDIRDSVKQKFGVTLEPEVNII